MKKVLFTLGIILFFGSCGNDKKFVELNLLFDHSLKETKYPAYFNDISKPFSSDGCSLDFFLKPINVARLDISNKVVETNAWYFEERGDEITIDYAKMWLNHYFKDSLIVKHLTLPDNNIDENRINEFINKKKTKYNIIILSEDSDADEYDGVRVLHSAKDVNKRIQEISCKLKSDKIYVLVNPLVLKDKEPNNTNKITQLLEEADILFNNKDYQGAESKYNEVLNLDKTNRTALDRISSIKKTVTTTTTTTTIKVGEKPKETNPVKIKKTYKITNDGSAWTKKNKNEYHSNYGRYDGGIVNGKMDGQGVLVFYKSHFIPVPKYSSYRIKAERGDKLSGRFNKGYFVTGFLYDKNGKKKKAILAGK